LVALIAVAIEALHMNRRVAEAMRGGRRAREQMQLFASAVEQTADAVIITDPRGVIEYVNPAFTRVTGYAPEEVHGRTPAILKSGQHDVRFYQRLWDTITRGDVYRDEIINRRKDGTLYIEQKSIMALRDVSGKIAHFVAAGRDITEQRRAEEEAHLRRDQLAHTARVNIIGEMAASVAHEISQPLTAIINYAQGSMRRLRSDNMEPARLLGVFEQIVVQAQRVADAVVMLRRFVARRKPQRVAADVNTLIRQVVALANSETRGRGISIVLELADNLPPALVDDVQIEQVVLNLLRNGAEALASADAPQRELRVRTARADDGSIEVAISDSGPGLPPRLAAKLFEPFFTTKPDGVGLGLAISRSIIENHGGRIWVTPNPERGVTFRFTVPVETQTHEQ
ncbi:MAG TPA: ATP-binding protein, partial [Burkholderiales bacterium]